MKKAFTKRFVLGISELRKLWFIVKNKATVDAYAMCIRQRAICYGALNAYRRRLLRCSFYDEGQCEGQDMRNEQLVQTPTPSLYMYQSTKLSISLFVEFGRRKNEKLMRCNKRLESIICILAFSFISNNIYAQYVPNRPIIREDIGAFRQALGEINRKNEEALSYVNAIKDACDDAIRQKLSNAALNHVLIETDDCLDVIKRYAPYGDYSQALSIARAKAPIMIRRINEIVSKDKYTDYYKCNSLIYGLKMGDNYSYVLKVLKFWQGEPSSTTSRMIVLKNISDNGFKWDEGSFWFDESTKNLNEIFLSRDFSLRESAIIELRNIVSKYGLSKYKMPDGEYYVCNLNGIKTTINVSNSTLCCKISLNWT